MHRTAVKKAVLEGVLDAVNPGVERVLTSARTGQGVDEWCSWLERRTAPS